MLKETYKYIWSTILVGIILYLIDFQLFIFYAFAALLFRIVYHTNYLGKLHRVFTTNLEMKLIGIEKKLGISEQDREVNTAEYEETIRENWGDKAVDGLTDDIEHLVRGF